MKVRNIPNLLSAFRIALVPVFIVAYFTDTSDVKVTAIIVYAAAALSDFLDGFIARRYKLVSNLGHVLDPLGDKMMLVAVLISITIDGVIPIWAVCVAVGKEALMGIGRLVIHRKKIEIPPSNILGKTSTVVFIAACLTLMIFKQIREKYAAALMFAAVMTMFLALGSYIMTFIGVVKKSKVNHTPTGNIGKK